MILLTMELRWLASHSASCFHAVELVAHDVPLVDAALADAIRQPAQDFLAELNAAQMPIARSLEHLVPLSAGIDNNRQLAQVLVTKILGGGSQSATLIEKLTGRISDVEAAVRRAVPHLADELSLRIGPLREQWEARGPGLLKQVYRLTDPNLQIERADVIAVHPFAGGGGASHLAYNSIRIEGVLTNPYAALPEVVRVAWLLGQLNCDLPQYCENLPRDEVSRIVKLALIPPTLLAGEYVELTRYDPPTTALAITAWRADVHDAKATAQVLMDWWATYDETRPRWSVALEALRQMVHS